MPHISRLLGRDSPQPAQFSQPEGVGADWYLSGRQGLREGMRLLEAVKREFLNLARIDERWHTLIDKTFGPQLRQLLTQWVPSDQSVVLLAHQLTLHTKTYGGSLPFSEPEDSGSGRTSRK